MAQQSRPSQPGVAESIRDALRDLPPSAKLVAKVLELRGASNQTELIQETLLPRRTVRFGLTRLSETGVLSSRPSLRDPRQKIYELKPPAEQE